MIKRDELTHPQSCLNKARDDELLFVLLERDAAFPAAVREWCRKRVELKLNDYADQQIIEALTAANKVEELHRGKA